MGDGKGDQDVLELRGWGGQIVRRPRIRPPRTRAEMGFAALAVFGLVALLMVTAFWWARLPEIIPTHFDAAGHPNAYGSKATFFLLPGALAALLALFAVLSRYPWAFNYPVRITVENAARQYVRGRTLLAVLAAVLAWLFTFLQWEIGVAAFENSGLAFSPALVIIFVVGFPLAMIGLIAWWAMRGT